jgi:uncharacterized Tic20 family protein
VTTPPDATIIASTELARRRAALVHLSALLLLPPLCALAAWLAIRTWHGAPKSVSNPPMDEDAVRTSLRDRFFFDDHAREAINFHLSLCVWWLAALFVAALTCLTTSGIAPFVLAYGPVCAVLAARGASKGRLHRYPMTLRILRA